MSLFLCSRCGTVENTGATSGYWANRGDGKPVLCSECADGKWHGLFPKRQLNETNYIVQPNGTLAPPGGWDSPCKAEAKP